MDYLQRLIQRSSMTTPHHMLLPRSNQCSDAADPFEQTSFIPPGFPDTERASRTDAVDNDSGQRRMEPAANMPAFKDHRQHITLPPIFDPVLPPAAHPAAPRTATHSKGRKTSTGIDSFEPANATSTPVRRSPGKPVTPGQVQKNPDTPGGESVVQPERPWGRRYAGDLNLADNPGKPSPVTEDALTRRAPGASPRPVLPPPDVRYLLPFTPASSFIKRRRRAGGQPHEAPRLVIGQLSVDVVPLKKKKPVKRQRRSATAKNRAHRHYSKLTQAETATIGFGIGQM